MAQTILPEEEKTLALVIVRLKVIHHGKGGFLCAVGDVEAFAGSIRTLAADAGLRRKMGEYNRARILAHYRASDMIEAYKALFARFQSEGAWRGG